MGKSEKKMVEKKERFELLLEEIKDNVKQVAEGHGIIRHEMQEMKNELKEDIEGLNDKLIFVAKELGGKIGENGQKIDEVKDKLDVHMKQPAHA